MILRAFVSLRQRPQHFIFLLVSVFPEREILGCWFPSCRGLRLPEQPGIGRFIRTTPAPGSGGKNLFEPERARPLSHLNERACKILKKIWSRKIRTETALFWTFSENMRIYTANGLRVKITGFFQEIITP